MLDDLDKIKQDTSLDEDADTTQKQKRSDSSSNQRQDRQQDSKINHNLILENCHNLTPKNNKH